jgi:hypothetical protein
MLNEAVKSRMVADSETTPAPCGSSSDVGGHWNVKSANRKLTHCRRPERIDRFRAR